MVGRAVEDGLRVEADWKLEGASAPGLLASKLGRQPQRHTKLEHKAERELGMNIIVVGTAGTDAGGNIGIAWRRLAVEVVAVVVEVVAVDFPLIVYCLSEAHCWWPVLDEI